MQFVRYLIVQVLAYGADLGLFILLLVYFDIGPFIANIMSKFLAGFFAFIAHHEFTFGAGAGNVKLKQGVGYSTLLALNIPFSALLLSTILEVIQNAVLAKLLADTICVALNYWLSRRFVFVGGAVERSKVGDNRGAS